MSERRARMAWALALALGLVAGTAPAHIVFGTPTVHQLTRDADLVVRIRILEPEAQLRIEDPLLIESVVVAEVLEGLKGERGGDSSLRFVQHGHGVPSYRKGEEVVLFLQKIERSREFGQGPIAQHIRWVSVQESGTKFPVDDVLRPVFTAAVRAYAGLEALEPHARLEALGRITVDLLSSPDPRLSSSALRDIVFLSSAEILVDDDLPQLEAILASSSASIGLRVGLLAELERRGLVEGPPRWAGLLRSTHGSDRFAVVRAAAAHPSEPVQAELQKLLASDDEMLVAAAAVSIGARGSASAVAPLTKLLAAKTARTRMAAIRGLGRIATREARQVLSEVAASHADTETRRRAAAEVRRLATVGARDDGGSGEVGRDSIPRAGKPSTDPATKKKEKGENTR